MKKTELLSRQIKHVDIKEFNAIPLIDSYKDMAFQARNLARAAEIYDLMIKDRKCSIILCLAGSLVSAGLKKVIYDLVDNNMVDVIVSTGANIVDQDFFEALGYKHYIGSPDADDNILMKKHVDRIYDTYICENELRVCDLTITKIGESLDAKTYSSREFIKEMGRYLVENDLGKDSIVRLAYEKNVPIFVPAFSDCSAGLGLAYLQFKNEGKPVMSIDSVKDFVELTKIKVKADVTGLLMMAGGTPKNFAQDTTVSAEMFGAGVKMHKYAIQITVADERDGALSGSTLKEAHSWGKVDQNYEQMVYSEVTLAMPLLAGYAYHRKHWKNRKAKGYGKFLT